MSLLNVKLKPDDVRMAQALRMHPDPTDLPPRRYDVHDAHAARRAILPTLGRSAR